MCRSAVTLVVVNKVTQQSIKFHALHFPITLPLSSHLDLYDPHGQLIMETVEIETYSASTVEGITVTCFPLFSEEMWETVWERSTPGETPDFRTFPNTIHFR